MKRTRATQLALVNWKGVFYQRYLLDEHVTALEGTNGAGKTTVMIAAYVVLLPDLSFLRFSNVGVSEATGGDKGIYGRLGEANSPSYAALDFRLGSGERLLAGVHLERKAEPNLNLTPFIISGLADDVSLQDLLLDRGRRDGELDAVPEFNRLKELAALSGAQLKSYSKTADYFSELFERGVAPLRLSEREERSKFNQMLHTSMVGGISQALTKRLREFLFSEETGLADTLKRIHANLDACRRTRMEVESSRRMEAEITGVFEAGQEMFGAAIHATRVRSDELHRQVIRAGEELKRVEDKGRDLAAELKKKELERAEVVAELEVAKAASEDSWRVLESVRGAHQIAGRIAKCEAQRVAAAERFEQAQQAEQKALDARAFARDRHKDAQKDVKSATLGLADFQKGIDGLRYRASAFRHISKQLELARRGLPGEDVRAETAPGFRQACEARVGELDRRIVVLERQLETADQRRREHEGVLAALTELCGAPISAQQALARARQELSALRELESLGAQVAEFSAQLEKARVLVAKQKDAWQKAARWSEPNAELRSQEDVRAAFDGADAQLEVARGAQASEHAASDEAEREVRELEGSIEALQALLPRWRALREVAARLAKAWQPERPLESRADVEALHRFLGDRRDAFRERHKKARARLDALLKRIEQLEGGGGEFRPEVLRARDAAEGELLAGHFDNISVEDAGRVQALLGPLAEAIVVDDIWRAAKKLAEEPRRPETVWLIEESTRLAEELERRSQSDEGAGFEDAVFVEAYSGYRMTTVPAQPTLGRRARTKLIEELGLEVVDAEGELARAVADERRVEDALTSVTVLLAEVGLLERADPAPELHAAQGRFAAAKNTAHRHALELERLSAQIEKIRARRGGLQGLLPSANLLDLPDQAEHARALERRLDDARAAKIRVKTVAEPRQIVEEGLDILREIPLSEAQLSTRRAQAVKVCEERDTQRRLRDALSEVVENSHALKWSDAPAALEKKQALHPVLNAQLKLAEEARDAAQKEQDAAEVDYESASERMRLVDAELKALNATLQRDKEEFATTGVEDASDAAVVRAEQTNKSWRAESERLDRQERELGDAVVAARVRHQAVAVKVEDARNELSESEAQWRPQAARWERLQQEAEEAGILCSVMTPAYLEQTQNKGSVNLFSEALSSAKLLIERLGQSEGGIERAQKVRDALDGTKGESGLAYLRAWLGARDWLRRRVPLQIAEGDDPLASLKRLRIHLEQLSAKLDGQERSLRGKSADVARNIETQRRKANRQVTQLNKELREIRFGSIHGLRIRVDRVERQERVLEALRSEEAQKFLFQTEMSFEDAMANIATRFGGGKTGGQRLLDYREYLELRIEVMRQAGHDWERAKPSQMSTGEAIGVGAAIMMVVLTAWERSANLLRAKRSSGTLRFLFLDEANRLSQDNLGVLFELCENLELQLLIAAPEIAQAQGNTTYRLIRQVDEDAREVVRVTGRRAIGSDA